MTKYYFFVYLFKILVFKVVGQQQNGDEMRKRLKVKNGDVLRWIKEGHGQGHGQNYRPFIHVRDVPSHGRSSMVFGLKTKRIHHYLSDGEYANHILAEFSPAVIDIREQFALLPWEVTQQIAHSIGVRHPTYPGTKTPTVMTSDLVLTLKYKNQIFDAVISVKGSPLKTVPQTRQNERTIQKLAIERLYWESQGVAWKLVTKDQLPMILVYNLDLLRSCLVRKNLDYLDSFVNDYVSFFDSI